MLSLSYILAASLKELFPASELLQVKASGDIFFCDIRFPETFSADMLPFLEERMGVWAKSKKPFHVLEMLPENGAQFLESKGERALAEQCREKSGLVKILQLDSFFFLLEGEIVEKFSAFKLVTFWPLKGKVRILGTCGSKEEIKAAAKRLKGLQALETRLEKQGLISWVGDQLVWEKRAEELKDCLRRVVLELYAGFDRVFVSEDVENILMERLKKTGRKAVQIGTFLVDKVSQEAWDTEVVLGDKSCGKAEEITSCLHLATKFLTMLSFDYQVIGTGRISGEIKKFLDAHEGGKGNARIECRVADSLGEQWTISTLEWDRECVLMSVCCSFERCLALLSDGNRMDRLT